jgi:hypothetical protein
LDENNGSIRGFLLSEALRFVLQARSCAGVSRIALIGSLASTKPDPKDVDLLLTVADNADLTALAAAGRQLKGRVQARNHGADIFLAGPMGRYIGRTCHYRDCRPGVRVACQARRCGYRPFLCDDLDVLRLPSALAEAPPLELWPKVVRRAPIPPDVEERLVWPLETHTIPSTVAADPD